MKIIKIKKMPKARYKITFDDGSDLIVYEEIIINHVLLTGKNVDDNLKRKIISDNDQALPYHQAINYINTKLRSREEIIAYLLKKGNKEDYVRKAITRLEDEGYINDEVFAKSFVNDKIHLSNDGIYKIRKGLERYKVDSDIIDKVISNVNDEASNSRIDKLISKQLRLNTKYTGKVLKNNIFNYLMNLGYDKDIILEKLEDYDFENNINIENEYNRLYRKYVKKYGGNKLDLVIRHHLFQRGYDVTDIENITNKKEPLK